MPAHHNGPVNSNVRPPRSQCDAPEYCQYQQPGSNTANISPHDMSDTIIAAWLGIAGTLAAGFGGAWLGARIAKEAGRELLTQQARAEFLTAFNDALVELHLGIGEEATNFAHNLMKTHFRAHTAAYLKLRTALPAKDRIGIDAAWRKYTKDDSSEHPDEREFHRFSIVFTGNNTEEKNQFAIKHINELLRAAA